MSSDIEDTSVPLKLDILEVILDVLIVNRVENILNIKAFNDSILYFKYIIYLYQTKAENFLLNFKEESHNLISQNNDVQYVKNIKKTDLVKLLFKNQVRKKLLDEISVELITFKYLNLDINTFFTDGIKVFSSDYVRWMKKRVLVYFIKFTPYILLLNYIMETDIDETNIELLKGYIKKYAPDIKTIKTFSSFEPNGLVNYIDANATEYIKLNSLIFNLEKNVIAKIEAFQKNGEHNRSRQSFFDTYNTNIEIVIVGTTIKGLSNNPYSTYMEYSYKKLIEYLEEKYISLSDIGEVSDRNEESVNDDPLPYREIREQQPNDDAMQPLEMQPLKQEQRYSQDISTEFNKNSVRRERPHTAYEVRKKENHNRPSAQISQLLPSSDIVEVQSYTKRRGTNIPLDALNTLTREEEEEGEGEEEEQESDDEEEEEGEGDEEDKKNVISSTPSSRTSSSSTLLLRDEESATDDADDDDADDDDADVTHQSKNAEEGKIKFDTELKPYNEEELMQKYLYTQKYKDGIDDVKLQELLKMRKDNSDNLYNDQSSNNKIVQLASYIDTFDKKRISGGAATQEDYKDIIAKIRGFENDPNNPLEALEIKFEDRLVFIIATFFIRYVAISMIQRGIDINLITTFYDGFIYYGCIYLVLFWFVVLFINIDDKYTTKYIDTSGFINYIRSLFYYFYMGTNGISRLLIHSLLLLVIIIIPIILNIKNKNNININEDTKDTGDTAPIVMLTLEERTKLSKLLSVFTLFIWILTSIIATKF